MTSLPTLQRAGTSAAYNRWRLFQPFTGDTHA
jgi:hypothetical protein